MGSTSRRQFLKSSVTAGAIAAGVGGGLARPLLAAPSPVPTATLSIKKGLVYNMLPSQIEPYRPIQDGAGRWL